VIEKTNNYLSAPMPYFGGKASVADEIWAALGDVKHYMEPFAGSCAVLLARPGYNPMRHVETICELDPLVANAWRAMHFKPDETARYCDWPISHCDLSARKLRMLAEKNDLRDKLIADENYCDCKLAGYWVWAANCWIGSGLTSIGQRPHLTNAGTGVHKLGQRPRLADSGTGVHKTGQIPRLADPGTGVHKTGMITNEPQTDLNAPYNPNIYLWFRRLSERLRHVRMVCGDWKRICGGNWQADMGTVGIFFDPPYGVRDRYNVYGDTDDFNVAHEVRDWCLERGKLPSYRIVLAGYDEHDELLLRGWAAKQWKTCGGYGNVARSDKVQSFHRRLLADFSRHHLAAHRCGIKAVQMQISVHFNKIRHRNQDFVLCFK